MLYVHIGCKYLTRCLAVVKLFGQELDPLQHGGLMERKPERKTTFSGNQDRKKERQKRTIG